MNDDARKQFFQMQARDREDTGPAAVEEKVVKAILKRAGVLPRLADIKEACEARTGSPRISLQWFQLEYPSFPVWLGARSVPWVRDLWGDLRDRFTKTELFKGWEAVGESQPPGDDRPVGLVFTWPQFAECVLHNHWRGGDLGAEKVPGVRILITLKSLGEPLVVEPLAQYLEYLAWEP